MSDIVLSCQGMARSFTQGDANIAVLSDINFSVARGERVAVVGASGSGKSTFLQLLGGLDRPSAGEVALMGQSLAGLSAAAAGRLRNTSLGFVYQFHHLLREFTALENVLVPLMLRPGGIAAATEAAVSMLERVGLGHRMKHRPTALSGGERQRVAIARALVTRPDCLLCDEPTGNLDHHTATRIHDLILELNTEIGTSLVVVTHDRGFAEGMSAVWELEDGVLRQL